MSFKKTTEYPPILKMNNLNKIHKFRINKQNIKIKSIKAQHGKINSIIYIINDTCAYASDVSKIYMKDINKFYNLKYFIVDCLRYDYHYSHFNLKEVLDLVKLIKPKTTILTNLNTDMDYDKLKKELPNNIIPAYDGMKILI